MDKHPLPPGWEWKTFADVCEVNPRRPSINRSDDAPTSFVPMAAVDEVEGRFARVETKTFGEIKRGYTYFEENDVVLAKITPCMENGKAAVARGLLDGFGFGTTEFHVLRPKPGVLPAWIHHFVRQADFRREAKEHFRGAVGQQRVPQDFLEGYRIPIPYPDDPARSLETQRRIVARIEALFAELRGARRLHAAIVADTGRVMEAAIREVFDQPTDGWQTCELGSMAFIQTGTAKGRDFKDRKTVELPYLRVANVQAGFLDLSEVKTIRIAESEISRYCLQPGDLLLTEGGDFDKLGRGAVWSGEIEPCIHQNHIFAVRFDQDVIQPEFVEYEMQSWHAKRYFLGVAKKTTNLATINRTQLAAFPLKFPALNEQRRIVAYLASARQQVAELERIQGQDDELLTEMEQAIIAQAFRGETGPDNRASVVR